MHVTDLLFLAAMLATVAAVILAFWRLVSGSRDAARRTAIWWASGAAVYLAVLLVVSLVQPGRVVPLGSDECFDDWCIAVTAAERNEARMVVTMRVSNRGRGRAQAEPDAYVYLLDTDGREIHPSSTASPESAASLDDRIPAGQSRTLQVTFDVPGGARSLSLVKARRTRFPGNVIIGDPASLLHRPTVHALGAASPISR
jgi:hypothetical protein